MPFMSPSRFFSAASAWLLLALAPGLFAQSNIVDASTLSNKFVLGYQGWHACGGDGKTLSGYVHWSHINRVQPSPTDVVCDMWPDLTEFGASELFATGFTLGNGQPAKAYSCYLTNTVLRHFKWMRDYGIDGVAFQRFLKDVLIDSQWAALKNTNLVNVRLGAETYGRVFFIMYDISNDDPATVISHLQTDWAYVTSTLQITNSSRYLKHRGKPLVALWGLGFNGGLASPPADGQTMINFFKSAGCTVLGGVPYYWRTLNGDSQTNAAWAAVYRSFDVLSPWAVGRYSTEAQADALKPTLAADLSDCTSNNIDYLPVEFPGYSAHNLGGGTLNGIPRNGGGFYWRQLYNALSAGCTMLFGAMFDEIDEGTALYKIAPTTNEIPAFAPTNQYQFFALNADGYSLPSDWYLRVTQQGQQTIHHSIPLNSILPITPTNQIIVTSPNGGNNWTAGAPATVSWSTTGIVRAVNIDLSVDGGILYQSLAGNVTNSTSKTIIVPFSSSTNCRVRVQSTNGAPVDWSDTNFTIQVTTASTNIYLQPLWNLAPGSRTYIPDGTGNTDRGLAYNSTLDELYLVNTSGSAANTTILDGTTGAQKGTLNVTGISGGGFVLDKIGVSSDGVIYAGNVQTSVSGSAPFKLYRWANSNSNTAPTLAYSGTGGFANGLRVGDTFSVRGYGTNTQIFVGARTVNTLCLLTTANGTNFTAQTLTTDANALQLGACLAFGSGNSFWGATNGLPPAQLNFDPISLVATTAQSFSATVFPPACGPFAVDPANSLLAAIILADGPDRLNLYDLSNPATSPALLASWTIPGATDNNFGLGSVAFGGNRLYALDANNGLLAFKIFFPGGATTLTAARAANTVVLSWPATNRGFFLENRPSVSSNSSWQTVLDPITITNAQNCVTQSIGPAASFYRLYRP
jgi:hypothetical protein